MQSQEQPQFRFNRQVVMIYLMTILALIIPVACVVLSLKDFFQPKPEASVSAAPLQVALEDIANKNLTPPPLAGSDQKIELSAQDPAQESQRIQKLAIYYSGVTLPDLPDGDKVRLLIQMPVSRWPSFSAACRRQLEPEARESTANDQASILVEVVIAKVTP